MFIMQLNFSYLNAARARSHQLFVFYKAPPYEQNEEIARTKRAPNTNKKQNIVRILRHPNTKKTAYSKASPNTKNIGILDHCSSCCFRPNDFVAGGTQVYSEAQRIQGCLSTFDKLPSEHIKHSAAQALAGRPSGARVKITWCGTYKMRCV